ncbi:ComEA family DNA-binding protein [Pseudonocardia humida]|uniref:Helix-hairpin-helix domain-containing protein n=1 Tax=Pseudonocardia humida TaxID=2800819 RepID=A0ABT1A0T0_9PSEU|nr:helix-hairpin-helix domain-containing protein [Pseudonocardia humida]MCO1656611.1 helix-hairpin-helix domain-containing protein [Pseudonocardia humida]
MARPDPLTPTTRLGTALRPAVVPPRLLGPGGEAVTWRAGGAGPPTGPPERPGGDAPPLPWTEDVGPPAAGPAPPPAADEPPTEPISLLAPRPGQGGPLRRLAPAGWRGARLDPGRPAALVLVLVATVAAVVAAVGVWSERPRVEPVAGLPPVVLDEPAAGAGAPSDAPAEPAGPLVVSVSGRVARPGLVEVPSGARVADALAAAGGALPGTDLTGLNLARRVADGEQVAVGVPPAPDATGPAPAGGAQAGPGAPAGKVDLNAATLEQLDALPGVGPVTAQRILEWRTRNGRFARVEQLREVEGIGERRFAQLRELVVV